MEQNNQGVSSADVREISYNLSTNLEDYLERFDQIEKGKNRFNFSAAFFQHLWLAYHFMFLDWVIICFSGLFLNLLLSILLQFQKDNTVSVVLTGLKIFFFFWVIKFILLGCFGDRLLYRSIKKRIKDNRKGTVNLITWMTSSEKTVVFRGIAVVTSEMLLLILSDNAMYAIVDWIVY